MGIGIITCVNEFALGVQVVERMEEMLQASLEEYLQRNTQSGFAGVGPSNCPTSAVVRGTGGKALQAAQ